MTNPQTTDPLDDLKTLALGRTMIGPNFYDVAPRVIDEIEHARLVMRECCDAIRDGDEVGALRMLEVCLQRRWRQP